MPRSTTRRIIKKKKQLKRKVKKQPQTNQQTKPQSNPASLDMRMSSGTSTSFRNQLIARGITGKELRSLAPYGGMGFAHQQYGNPDLAIQQMRNQGQMFTDQINNYRAVRESMKRENDKLQKALKEAKKESKKAKQDLESARTDYDIAKDDQTDNENIAKKAAHLRERANKLELQNLEERYDKDINDLHKKAAHYEDENHMLDMQNMHQRKTIEANTAAARLKEEEEKYKIKLAENQGQFEYMRSKRFTNPEEELKKVFSDQLKEEEMSRCIESRNKLDQETARLMERIQQNPKDYPAIQQQIAAENAARIEHIVDLQRINDRYTANKEEIHHLQQKEIELTNKNNDLDIENTALQKWNLSHEKKNVKARVLTATKRNVQLTADNEVLQEELDAERETQKQERKNKALKATKNAFENLANDPEIQQQIEDLAQKETELKMKQEIGNELDLTIKKTKQNQQAAFANDTKANVAGTIYNGDDSSGLGTDFAAVQQVNAGLDARIENEHELSEHIDNVQECDRLRQQIFGYKYSRDVNGDKWVALYKQSFPILRDGTNLTSIDDPRIIAQICDQYAEKNNTGIKYNNVQGPLELALNDNSGGDSGNFNDGNLFVEEEDE